MKKWDIRNNSVGSKKREQEDQSLALLVLKRWPEIIARNREDQDLRRVRKGGT